MKVAIYCRLSEEDRHKINKDDDSQSIQNQKSMLLDYAINQGWEVYNIYSDDDYAGSDRNRPEFNRLLRDAQDRKFFLEKSQSRFTREMELVEKYIHCDFVRWGIRFVSIVDNADTSLAGNKKSRQINGLVNEWFLEDLSENIKSVLTDKRKRGQHIGSFTLYGYKKDPDKKGHLLIDEPAAKVVKKIFEMYASGKGVYMITRYLNECGVPCPSMYKRQKGEKYLNPKAKNNFLWCEKTVSSIITNEMYIGNMVQNKFGIVSYKVKLNRQKPKEEWIIVKNTHEPVIDMDLWNRVQNLKSQRIKPNANGEIGLFAKKAKCMYCGYALRSLVGKGVRYLSCPTHRISKTCSGSFISVKKLERIVFDELKKLLNLYAQKDMIEKDISFTNKLKSKKCELSKQLESFKKNVEEKNKCIKDLYLDKSRGLISQFDYCNLYEEFSNDRERLNNVIAKLQNEILHINENQATKNDHKYIVDKYINIEKLTRPIVEQLIDYILIGKRIKGTKNVPVEIHWNF